MVPGLAKLGCHCRHGAGRPQRNALHGDSLPSRRRPRLWSYDPGQLRHHQGPGLPGEEPKPKNKEEKGMAREDPEVCAKDEAIPDDSLVVDPKTKGVRNGFVYLPKPTGQNPEALKTLVAKEAKVEIDQKNCRFVPHVIA